MTTNSPNSPLGSTAMTQSAAADLTGDASTRTPTPALRGGTGSGPAGTPDGGLWLPWAILSGKHPTACSP
jgi:hypothetical protein